ncbi:molybdopterin biosynthesis protein MoeB [Pseudovibrio axinellae]|uniref:Molybdopterin biosynthesis protein MoeB n=1 Tax=Pseudovibrio axinellae TaxID=989403 RepID=A0A165W0D5_9HYPH|nr:rhodanese-like domain-containing protein [Pseudovibrio axinellae]KZL15757.1 molybdopterin biosynthesis protein MoeB [Pseudovibrio axinellae]SEQ62970.1 Rhodanese-related sulfurtransferase [Pseudovibrio axinellae]
MSSRVAEYPCADHQLTKEYFGRKLRFETDCTDVEADLKAGSPDFVLLDVRGPIRFAKGHVRGAICLAHRDLCEETLAKWAKDTLFVVYCAGPHCNGADKAAYKLSMLGRNVKQMLGGVTGWLEEGFELVSSADVEPAA